MAKSERQKAMNAAWKNFSKYIRLRDTIKGYGRCCTCNRPITFSTCDAGHFIPGRKYAYIFEETNCHAQCINCNRYNQGAWVEYEQFIINKYGLDECERLKSLKHKIVKYSIIDIREISKYYLKKYKELMDTINEGD